ncbi:hypothetical protein V6U90_26840 [Micromonospora sp. CPCC 206060]|uniref:hypothetical protein n=1 Tax=Micromonospora sp. CPCC 206060 TaxID=3122406 RepID=UPI002FF06DBF
MPATSGSPEAPAGLHVTYDGAVHPAREIARGAAYELFSARELAGFEWTSRTDAPLPWHRVVHVTEVDAVHGVPDAGEEPEAPLLAPVHRNRGWADLHRLSQQPAAADDPVVAALRASARIRRGTRMIKVLSARQLADCLRGQLPYGFCHREHDVAHLRTPSSLAVLRTDDRVGDDTDVAYVLRWRAIDGCDYASPVGSSYRGLTVMPPGDRIGAAVLGTGFLPSGAQLVPEFVTRDFADLPLPAHATLVAYPGDGVEVVLYTYQAEQRGWLRMAGPRWRHLLAGVPRLSPDQDYLPVGETPRSTVLVGALPDGGHEAVADPPGGFRVLAAARAARHSVTRVSRRVRYATWRGVPGVVLREETGWLRLRLCRPDVAAVGTVGARCVERGIYETWAPVGDVTDDRTVDLPYPA